MLNLNYKVVQDDDLSKTCALFIEKCTKSSLLERLKNHKRQDILQKYHFFPNIIDFLEKIQNEIDLENIKALNVTYYDMVSVYFQLNDEKKDIVIVDFAEYSRLKDQEYCNVIVNRHPTVKSRFPFSLYISFGVLIITAGYLAYKKL